MSPRAASEETVPSVEADSDATKASTMKTS